MRIIDILVLYIIMINSGRALANIPEVLVPYAEFDPGKLAVQLHELVNRNVEDLALRGLTGVVARYSDINIAEQKVRKGQAEQATIGHFAVINSTGDVIGAASIYPKLPLRKHPLPLPPRFARWPIAVSFPYANPNVHAWVDHEEIDGLAAAYKGLVHRATGRWKRPSNPKPWTIEPAKSPQQIHEAIMEGGLERVATGGLMTMRAGIAYRPHQLYMLACIANGTQPLENKGNYAQEHKAL